MVVSLVEGSAFLVAGLRARRVGEGSGGGDSSTGSCLMDLMGDFVVVVVRMRFLGNGPKVSSISGV